jgi:hypothetical protein
LLASARCAATTAWCRETAIAIETPVERPREIFLERGQRPRVPLPPQLELPEGRPRPQEIRRPPLLLPQVRGLLELVAQQRPLLVLRLPPHETRPGLQQRLVHDLDPMVARLALLPLHLVCRQQPRVDELAEDIFRSRSVGKGRQQLLAVDDGAGALGGDEVAEDLADGRLTRGADVVHRGLGVLGEGALDPGDLPVGLAGEELPLPVALLPQPRHRECEEGQRAADTFHG